MQRKWIPKGATVNQNVSILLRLIMAEKYKEIDIHEVPPRGSKFGKGEWFDRLRELPLGRAGFLAYNNRQRAAQVADSIKTWSKYHDFKTLKVRTHHDIFEGYLVYFWLEDSEDIKAEEAIKMIENIPGYPRKKDLFVQPFKIE